MLAKVKSQAELYLILKKERARGRRIAFARGCFDLLHPGHILYLAEAKKSADLLVVWVNHDRDIRKLKGNKRPIFSAAERARLLAALASVDYIVFFNDREGIKIIKRFQPDIVVLSQVTMPYRRAILESGGQIKIVKIVRSYSTTKIINLILSKYAK